MPFLKRISTLTSSTDKQPQEPVDPTYSALFVNPPSGTNILMQNSLLRLSQYSEICIEIFFTIANFSASSYIFIMSLSDPSVSNTIGYHLFTTNNQRLAVDVAGRFTREINTSTGDNVTQTNIYSLNAWNHVVIQNKNNTLYVYHNGKFGGSRSSDPLSSYQNDKFALNRYTNATNEAFLNGLVGDVRICNKCQYVDSNGNPFSTVGTQHFNVTTPLRSNSDTIVLINSKNSSGILTDKGPNNISRQITANITFNTASPFTYG